MYEAPAGTSLCLAAISLCSLTFAPAYVRHRFHMLIPGGFEPPP